MFYIHEKGKTYKLTILRKSEIWIISSYRLAEIYSLDSEWYVSWSDDARASKGRKFNEEKSKLIQTTQN